MNSDADSAPPRRLVLLGASNLTRRLASVLSTAREFGGPPAEILAALGRGRSYGAASRFLGRELPGITRCGLWPAIARLPAAPTTALVTDIGNDVLYGFSVEQIVAWVDNCLTRLEAAGAATAITRLPVENLRNLSERRFLFFRSLFLPRCRLSLSTVRERVVELDARIADLGQRRHVAVVKQQSAWYGLDPLHIRRGQSSAAWQTVWQALGATRTHTVQPISLIERCRLALLAPEESKRFGRARRAEQPAARLGDGATIAVY